MPKTHLAAGMFIPEEGAAAGTEPLGVRIREVPVNAAATAQPRHALWLYRLRSHRQSEKGGGYCIHRRRRQDIAVQCGVCHQDQNAVVSAPVPPLAGRSPKLYGPSAV